MITYLFLIIKPYARQRLFIWAFSEFTKKERMMCLYSLHIHIEAELFHI